MKFNKLKTLLLERNIYYKVPKDKEELMYDFYMLTYIRNLPYNKKAPTNHIEFDNIGITTSVREASEDLVNYLNPRMQQAIEFAVAAEFRHIFDFNDASALKAFFKKWDAKKFLEVYAKEYAINNSSWKKFTDRDRELIADRLKDNSQGYKASYEALLKSKVPMEKIMKMAEDAFDNLHWGSNFGGEKWAMIARGWKYLANAEKSGSYLEKVIAIDHAYDLQHNTNTVFNKLRSYYKQGKGYEWIFEALEHKKHIKNVWSLFDYVTPEVKVMTGYIAKQRGWGSYEMILNTLKNNKAVNEPSKPSSYDLQPNPVAKLTNPDPEPKPAPKPEPPPPPPRKLWGKDDKWEYGVYNSKKLKSKWDGGTFEGGIWEDGTWHDGIWEDGTWEKGTWKKGTWEKGTWQNGTWEDGTWEDGSHWNGDWFNGTWIKGNWFNGVWYKGIWKGGTWHNGEIYDPDKKGNYEDDWEWDDLFVKSPISPKEYWKGVPKKDLPK